MGGEPFTNVDMVSIVVEDQQEALEWYTGRLDFEVRRDSPMPDGEGRWVTVGVPGQDDLDVVLEPTEWGLSGAPEEKEAVIGKNTLSLRTEDVRATVEELRERGVDVVTGPEAAPWGTFALIEDCDGNTLHVIEPEPFEEDATPDAGGK